MFHGVDKGIITKIVAFIKKVELRLPSKRSMTSNNVVPSEHQVPVQLEFDRMPKFWERSSLFFANLHSLFFGNTGGTSALDQQVVGVTSYGGRLLPIQNMLFRGDDNLLLVERPPDVDLVNYFKDHLGLELPNYMILERREYDKLPETLEEVENHFLFDQQADWVDGFVTDQCLAHIAQLLEKETISTFDGSHKGNNKYLLHCHLQDQGLDVFDTEIAANASQILTALNKLKKRGYKKAVAKAQIGASGCGIIQLPTSHMDLASIKDYLFYEGSCMVQGWMDESYKDSQVISSPSVQMFLGEEGITFFDMTEQLLTDESVHQGNISPPPFFKDFSDCRDRLIEQAKVGARWLYSMGYRGTASGDFLVLKIENELKVILCELNARVTGATYPAILARHFLPKGGWLLRNVLFRKPMPTKALLELLNEKEFLFKSGHERGVVVYNIIHNDNGDALKGQLVSLAQTPDQCQELLDHMVEQLPLDWDYDRD